MPSARSGMKISQTPDGISRRMTCVRPSHRLKSPMTLTRCAFGAQTAKCTPRLVADRHAMRAKPLPRAIVRALGEQVQVEIAQYRAESIRVADLAALRSPSRTRNQYTNSSAGGRRAAPLLRKTLRVFVAACRRPGPASRAAHPTPTAAWCARPAQSDHRRSHGAVQGRRTGCRRCPTRVHRARHPPACAR